MGYKLTQAPSLEPLTVADMKTHLRIDATDDDTVISLLIVAVRQYCEQATANSFVTQKWSYVADRFFGECTNAIYLEKTPIQSIDSVTYLDLSGTTQTMPATDYAVDLTGTLARITPRFGKVWPITLPQIGAVAVNFTAGYGAPADVPEGLKSWMKLRIGSLYENREDVLTGARVTVTEMPFIDSLLDSYVIRRA